MASIEADLRLAAAIGAKDRKAAAELVEAHGDTVYAYVAHRLFPNEEAAEDVVQEVFLAALQHMDRYTGQAPLAGWLLGIARHKVEDHYRTVLRDAARREDADGLELEEDSSIELALHQEHERERTVRTLARVREDYRLLLRWRYWELKSASEMAALTGRTEKSIERALARARMQFKSLWEEAGG